MPNRPPQLLSLTSQTPILLAVLMLSTGPLCLSCDTRSAALAQPATESKRFDPSTVIPGESVRLVRSHLDGGKPALARAAAESAMKGADEDTRNRLRWLIAKSFEAEDKPSEAAAEYQKLAATVVGPWATLRAAKILLKDAPASSVALTKPLTDGWAGAKWSHAAYAKGLLKSGDEAAAEKEFRFIVDNTPQHVAGVSGAMPLAGLLAKREELEAKKEALRLYQRIATRIPAAPIAEEATGLANALLGTLPAAERRQAQVLSEEDATIEAEAWLRSRRYKTAEDRFAKLAKRIDRKDKTRQESCEARFQRARAVLKSRDRKRAAPLFIEVAKNCHDKTVVARAAFLGARSLSRTGQFADAIKLYDVVVDTAPEHYLADDSLYRGALAAMELNDPAMAKSRMETIANKYQSADMYGETVFRLAMAARRQSDWQTALRHLDEAISNGAGESREDTVGRAAYWRARTLADLGRGEEAVYSYAQLAQTWPLSYYAQQAVARLSETDKPRADAVLASWKGQLSSSQDTALLFPWRAEMDDPGFVRALDLLRLGEFELADSELEHLGALGEGADRDMLWLVAALYQQAGRHSDSIHIVRRRLKSFRHTAPVGEARKLWRLAYPEAYAPLIENTAKTHGVPHHLVRAIAREESSFNPGAVSGANAYGLIQVIRPTAKRWAKVLGLPSGVRDLKTPEINVPIGTRFMKFLQERSENPALIPSAYNAGPYAVKRWVKERGEQPLDEFIESIPYDETRHYTRRVLQSYGTYQWLADGTLPPLKKAVN